VAATTPPKNGTLAIGAGIVVTFNQAVVRASVIPCATSSTPSGCDLLLEDAGGAAVRLLANDVAQLPASLRFGHRPLAAASGFTLTVKGGPSGPAALRGGADATLPAGGFAIHFVTP